MKKVIIYLFIVSFVLSSGLSCVATKKRNETSKAGKFYHNTTAYYNGYWNANEIMKESLMQLRLANNDDYNKILEVEDFVSVDNPKMVKGDMDRIIEKVSTVAQLHEPSDWVDDCYVMMAKAQYVKQEYETAEETLEYFQEDFNPSNPYGRNYKSKKLKGKASRKAKEIEKKEKEEQREQKAKEREELKKEKAKQKEKDRKEKQKERERERKEREKQRKEAAKNRKKGIKETPKSKEQEKLAPETKNTETQETKTPEVAEAPEAYKPIEPKTPEKDKTAYSEGLLWLAKVYIKRENWFPAQMILEKLKPEMLPSEVVSELAPTYANFYIKQKKYAEALPQLYNAIETAPNRNLKGRYAFIAGQLHQELKNTGDALKYFALADKYTNNPKMSFMSEMAVAKNGLISGQKTKEQVIKDLEKMLKADKYKDLKDQIYFTMGEVEQSQGNEDKAIVYYQQSLNHNLANQKLKAEAYYNIANIHYVAENYLLASTYFDSTRMNLQPEDSRFEQVKKYTENLEDIAYNISLINYQDTLLYFANMDEDSRRKPVYAYLERNQIKPKSDQEEPKSIGLSTKVIGSTAGSNFNNSSFFAYNSRQKEKGRESFNKQWGNIQLEDDWRRSERAFVATNGKDDFGQAVSEAEGTSETVSKDAYEAYVREIPSTPMKEQQVNDKIMSAMFTLGKLFRDKIQNYDKSAMTLENMHLKYGPTPYELDSYFYLYLDYLDLNDQAKANEYKDKIIRKYPDSKYTAILSDPDFYKKLRLQKDKSEMYYQTIYRLFENGDYVKVVSAVQDASNVISADNPYAPKMGLIYAMAKGNTEGKEAYIRELNKVVSSYPNTPEQLKATEILRFLGGDKNAFLDVKNLDKMFQRDETSIHYVAAVTYNVNDDLLTNFKIAISEYNKKNFKQERLQLGDATLNIEENVQIILIRKFDNEAKAMDYYKKVKSELAEFSGNADFIFDVLPISQSNYRKMMGERSAVGYRSYFETSIMGQ